MATFSIVDALSTLCTSIPEWNSRLEELNGQIALRQIELARLTDSERPPTARSLKNKGSTESLRPKDGENENPFSNNDDIPDDALESSKAPGNGFATAAGARAAAVITPPPLRASSNPQPSAGALTRQSAQPTPPTQARLGLRKRKTDSLASAESNAPKYRTRSMIIVYYDSAVQTAFEELVKFVSASRNTMRKGKMAAKMAEMRRAAELEVDNDDDDDDDGDGGLNDLVTNSGNLLAAQKNVSVSKEGQSQAPGLLAAGDGDSEDFAMPKLKFVSTRQMGPPRGFSGRSDNLGGMSVGILRGYRRGAGMGAVGEAPDIFDDLDKGLEWCQSQCEHAAHQFLRDGDCSTEIENIKRKLAEVKQSAEQEVEKLKKEEAVRPPPRLEAPKGVAETGKARERRAPLMRRQLGTPKDLEVDDMEVDDEGVDDLDLPPKLIFKRSRDIR